MLIERLKSSGLEPLFEKLNTSLRLSQERSARLERENQLLRQLRRLDLLEKYGPAGEQLSDEQLELLELEPGVSSAEVKAESEREQLKLPLKESRQHPGRQELPAHLPRVEKIIACSPEQCICGHCGKRNRGDRLRAERATRCRTGQILRGGDQARKACLQRL